MNAEYTVIGASLGSRKIEAINGLHEATISVIASPIPQLSQNRLLI
jgi:hypothetical protein